MKEIVLVYAVSASLNCGIYSHFPTVELRTVLCLTCVCQHHKVRELVFSVQPPSRT
jgi:hypothetical protein